MTTPYSSLPDRAYWRRAVATPAPGDVDPVDPPPFGLAPTDKVMTAGSCFAQHIARYLRESGFNAMLTEPPHPVIAAQDASLYNYGTFTARYGNIYVARQLLQLFHRAYGSFTPVEDIWPGAAGSFIDPFRPQIQPGGFASLREYQIDRAQHFAAVRRGFEELDVFVFTLGLTEAWVSRQDGAVFPLCPGVAGGQYDPARHVFHNFGVDEIVADLTEFIRLLRGVNRNCRIILTVSPVPLIATASGKHVLSATTWSKSVLRVACDSLEKTTADLFYFPSYEVIVGPHNRGSYFAEDLRAVREEGVAHVMRLFFRSLTGSEQGIKTAEPAPTAEDQPTRAMADLVKLVCDEETLDHRPPAPAVLPPARPPLPDRVTALADGVVVPLGRYSGPQVDAQGKLVPGRFDGGAYRADGTLLARGESKFNSHVNDAAPKLDLAGAARLPGRHLFIGMVQNAHFGHFISENIGRLWALDQLGPIDGIVHFTRIPGQPLQDYICKIFDFLVPGVPVRQISQPTRVTELLVPDNLCFPVGFISGHPLNRAFFARQVLRAQQGRPTAPRRIFVSRAALAPAGAKFLLESRIDDSMRAEGYTVIHPERLSIEEQLWLYAGADVLVFSEGSAIHLYALAARPDQQLFLIWRRRVMHPVFARQLESFGGPKPQGQCHVKAMLPHNDYPTAPARAQSLLDFASLGAELIETGFISGQGWQVPTPAQIKAALYAVAGTFQITEALAAS